MRNGSAGRALVVLAAGMLFLDGVLLMLAGMWMSRAGLFAFGIVLVLGGFAVIVMWRRWRAAVRSIDDARRALRTERDTIRTLLERAQHHR